MEWVDKQTYIEVQCPSHFHFDESLIFLKRSDQEILHRIEDRTVFKALDINNRVVLFSVTEENGKLILQFLKGETDSAARRLVATYVINWFDLDRDISPFYRLAQQDAYMKPLVKRYSGLRIVGIPDLFEALVWAIAGQQINLNFAYTLKRRLIELCGKKLVWHGEAYWLFPQPADLADCTVEMLRQLQFSSRKAEYILGVAKMMRDGVLQHPALKEKGYQGMKKELLSIRGIGAWTADYVLIKCFRMPNAFPIADAGIHQALNRLLGWKPSIEEIAKLARNWAGWEAYATIYLWRSLYE